MADGWQEIILKIQVTHKGPVVWKPISANPGLNFNMGFLFFCSETCSWIIFSVRYRVSNHHIAGKKN